MTTRSGKKSSRSCRPIDDRGERMGLWRGAGVGRWREVDGGGRRRADLGDQVSLVRAAAR
jgi:hypothetical protein